MAWNKAGSKAGKSFKGNKKDQVLPTKSLMGKPIEGVGVKKTFVEYSFKGLKDGLFVAYKTEGMDFVGYGKVQMLANGNIQIKNRDMETGKFTRIACTMKPATAKACDWAVPEID